MKGFTTIVLLILANIIIFFAWYGPLKFKEFKWLENVGVFSTILITWAFVFFVCAFQVPANKFGYAGNGGPFTLVQLKVIQEIISLLVFIIFTFIFFKNETFKWNHFIGFIFLILAVYFLFKK
jgi:hypothetical protein